MSERQAQVVDDPELLDLFADDPGALAVVDAIAATKAQSRSAHRRVLLIAAAIVAAALTAVLTEAGSQAGVIDKALHALATSRVIRIAVEDQRSAVQIIDLRTGRRRTVPHEIVEWFDPNTGRRRVRDSIAGVVVSDSQGRSSRSIRATDGFTSLLAAFPVSYRRALERASERDVSRREIGRQPVYWVRFRAAHGLLAVALGGRTYEPVRIVLGSALSRRTFIVRSFTRVSLSPALFESKRAAVVRPANVFSIRSGTPPAAILAVAPRAYKSVSTQSIVFRQGRGVAVVFAPIAAHGTLPHHFVRVEEATFAASTFGWTSTLVALTSVNRLVIEQEGSYRNGFVRIGQRFVRVETSESRATLLTVVARLGDGR